MTELNLPQVGDKIPVWEMPSVTRERMQTMAAILRDPNPVHWDEDLVSNLPANFGKRTVNQGPLGLSYMINMLHDWAGPESVKRVFMTFPMAVLSEDKIIARGVVTKVSIDGMVECDIWLDRNGERPLEGNASVQFGK